MVPKLKLKGDKNVTLLLGEEYVEPGYSAKAEDGTDLTSDVKVSGAKFDRAGTFKIYYTATDSEALADGDHRAEYELRFRRASDLHVPLCL